MSFISPELLHQVVHESPADKVMYVRLEPDMWLRLYFQQTHRGCIFPVLVAEATQAFLGGLGPDASRPTELRLVSEEASTWRSVTVRFPPHLRCLLAFFAERWGCSRSDLVYSALHSVVPELPAGVTEKAVMAELAALKLQDIARLYAGISAEVPQNSHLVRQKEDAERAAEVAGLEAQWERNPPQ